MMTAFRSGVVGTVIRKDFLSLWPLALSALLLPICLIADATSPLSTQTRTLLTMIGGLATVALVLTVIHQDSPASVRHDWRSRPIGALNLSAAKAAFLCLAVAVPMLVAHLVQQRAEGHMWSEATISSLSMLTSSLFVAVPVVVLGLVTTSLVEAGVLGFGLVGLALVFSNVVRSHFELSGTRWVGDLVAQAIALAFCVAAVVLLFRRKNVFAARAALIVGSVLVFFVARYFPLEAAVWVQQQVSPRSQVADRLVTRLVEPCVDGDILSAWKEGATVRPGAQAQLVIDGLPQGWRVQVDDASVRYLDAAGKTVGRTGASAVRRPLAGENGGWALVADIGPFTSAKSMQWTYAVTLLEPAATHDLPVDGRRRFLPNLGYCDAEAGRNMAHVSCFKPFRQPAMLSARLKGAPESLCLECGQADYTPAILSGFGKARHAFTQSLENRAPLDKSAVVTLTTYEADAHISRTSMTSAPRADAAQACPRRASR